MDEAPTSPSSQRLQRRSIFLSPGTDFLRDLLVRLLLVVRTCFSAPAVGPLASGVTVFSLSSLRAAHLLQPECSGAGSANSGDRVFMKQTHTRDPQVPFCPGTRVHPGTARARAPLKRPSPCSFGCLKPVAYCFPLSFPLKKKNHFFT